MFGPWRFETKPESAGAFCGPGSSLAVPSTARAPWTARRPLMGWRWRVFVDPQRDRQKWGTPAFFRWFTVLFSISISVLGDWWKGLESTSRNTSSSAGALIFGCRCLKFGWPGPDFGIWGNMPWDSPNCRNSCAGEIGWRLPRRKVAEPGLGTWDLSVLRNEITYTRYTRKVKMVICSG